MISRDRRKTGGQALVEFALLLPLVLLLIANVVNFGGFFYAWISVANAARAGADDTIMGGATVGGPPAVGAAELVTEDLRSLPNSATGLQVNVCKNTTTAPVPCGKATLAADPEAPQYASGMVEVTYTYVPFIPLWNLPLGIQTTIPPTTVHRVALMRLEQ